MDWKSFEEQKICIHCDTEEKAKSLLAECEEYGCLWGGYERPTKKTHWELYENKTVYFCNGRYLSYSDIEYAVENNVEIVEYGLEEKTMIKDSGERRGFDTGAVRDIQDGKGRMDLLPWAAIMEVSKHCEAGAIKYGEHNVDKGIPLHSLCDSAARHLAKFIDGQEDEPHLLAATWNLLWAIQMQIKHKELCDLPWENNHKE